MLTISVGDADFSVELGGENNDCRHRKKSGARRGCNSFEVVTESCPRATHHPQLWRMGFATYSAEGWAELLLPSLSLPAGNEREYKAVFKQVHRLLLFLVLLWALAPPSTQAQVINCPSGFASTGDCGVGFVGSSPEAFLATDFPAFNGPALELIQANANHNAASLIYQTQLNIQAFTASFTFTTSGWAVAFVVQNSNNNPASNGYNFTAGAGCEADFFQGASAGGQTTPPNNVFALDFDSYSPLVNGQPFSYSSVQIYQSDGITTPAPYVQCPCEPSIEGCGSNNSQSPINKISTSPVPLNSPANVMNTATGDTYSATATYDGSNFTLNLYDVTAGGSCPGSSCFTYTWTNVNIPASVGGPTAWVGIGASTGSNPILDVPLYIHSFVYTEGTPTSTPTPTHTPTPTSTPTPKPSKGHHKNWRP